MAKTIGLTGGIGSGKLMVANYFLPWIPCLQMIRRKIMRSVKLLSNKNGRRIVFDGKLIEKS
jgi:dephospho-CoA kinase